MAPILYYQVISLWGTEDLDWQILLLKEKVGIWILMQHCIFRAYAKVKLQVFICWVTMDCPVLWGLQLG